MFFEFELARNAMEVTKNICCAVKGEDTIDHSSVTRWFMKFRKSCKNVDDQVRSSIPKSVDLESVL